ncbi:TPA: NUDIX hydrolase [Enterococcus faecium]|nr:NUDIX hydrolase [Enterococcus faecium]
MRKVEKTERLIENRWLTVIKEKVNIPNGLIIDDFYTVTIPDAAAIVALDTEGNIILKKEYKHATKEDLIEVPAGMFEPNETDGLALAKRELLEETGYESDCWEYFGDTIENSSKLTNRNCSKIAGLHLDATEVLEPVIVPFEEAIEMVMRNEIKCNSSAHGILRAARKVGK